MVEVAYDLRFNRRLSYDSHAGGIAVPAVLKSGRNTVELLAHVDTGASDCLFEREFAEALDLRVEDGVRKTYSTANSRFNAYGHDVTLEVLGVETHTVVYFFAEPDIVRNVLGRRGFLDRVRIGIVEHDQMLYLAGYND